MTVLFDNGATMTMSAANVLASFAPGTTTAVWGFNAGTGLGTNKQQVQLVSCQVTTPCSLTVSASVPALGCSNGNVIYIGYGPQSVTATSNQTGTTFVWFRNATPDVQVGTGATFTPTVAGSYYVVATNGNCTASTENTAAQITVEDIRCGTNKVYLCHKEEGVHGNGTIGENAHTLCVNVNAVAAHLAHGCCLGMCPSGSARPAPSVTVEEGPSTVGVSSVSAVAFPNPNRGQFQLTLNQVDPKAQILVVNAKGAIVESRNAANAQTFNFDLKKYGVGVYLVKVISGNNIKSTKVIVQD
jgi:hypothetical protein